MTIDSKTVEKLAELSRMEFSAKANKDMVGDLHGIMEFISKLQEVNTEGVELSNFQVSIDEESSVSTLERADEVTAENDKDACQSVAPSVDMGFYVVPRVIE